MNDLDSLESDVYEKGLIIERSYYEFARRLRRLAAAATSSFASRRSQDVVLDPGCDTYDPEQWPQVITRRYWSYSDIESTFGKEAAKELGLRDMPGWVDYEDAFMAQQMGRLAYYQGVTPTDSKAVRGYLVLDRQHYVYKMKEVFVDLKTGDMSEIPENWERNRVSRVLEVTPGLGTMRHNMKTVRWDVTCESTTLHSEDSPYKRFTIVPFFPSFIDGVTMGACENWVDSANLFNKMTSQELHIINTTANSGYKVKRGSLRNMTIKQLEQRGSKPASWPNWTTWPTWRSSPPTPRRKATTACRSRPTRSCAACRGLPEPARAASPATMPPATRSSRTAPRRTSTSPAGWATCIVPSACWRVTAATCGPPLLRHPHVIQINRGSSLNPVQEQMTINQITPEGRVLNDPSQGQFSTVLVPAPSRTTMSESDFKLMLELRKLGISIPDSLLLELSPASNKAQIIASVSGGPDSNDRQRQAEELAAQQQQIDAENARAAAVKQQASAQLDMARAEKAQIEARTDPEAAYKQVEFARIEADREATHLKHATDNRKLDIDERRVDHEVSHDNKSLALDVAKLDSDHENKDADREARREESRMARRGDKKPGAQKSK
jgi:hypothetical protein